MAEIATNMDISNQSTDQKITQISTDSKQSGWIISPINLILLGLIGIIGYLIFQNDQLRKSSSISNYEECLASSGSLIQESYPATCVSKSGQRFVQKIDPGINPEPVPPDFLDSNLDSVESGASSDSESSSQKLIESNFGISDYSSSRVNSYHQPFSLSYPADWQLISKSQSSSGDDGSLSFSLTKNTAKISIDQGEMGGGGCLYPGDDLKDGMYEIYEQPTELTKAGTRWRIAAAKDSQPLIYTVCEFDPKSKFFTSLTKIGRISLALDKDNAKIVQEFNQIIESLKLLP